MISDFESLQTFNEERVKEIFRTIKNRIQKYQPQDIVITCIKKLNERPQDLIHYPPWRLFLLIKWTIVFGEYLPAKRRLLTTNDFNHLMNMMHDLEGRLRHPSEYENLFLFFRNMAFQQFWLQGNPNLDSLARQSILFGKLDKQHPFQQKMLEKYRISLEDYIELSFILMSRFVSGEKSVTLAWFDPVSQHYGKDKIEKFLELLSIDFDSLKNRLTNNQVPHCKIPVSYEVYEKTPLREKPMLKYNNNYYTFSPILLARTMETLLYDMLRTENAEDFMEKFGPIFEKYMSDTIAKTGIKYLTEKELRKILLGQGKIVDFLLMDGKTKVFIDAKGVEMSYLGMVGHDPTIIKDRTKDSIIKGIKQGFETAARAKTANNTNDISGNNEDNYLIIVTFKDLYVGNGADFHEYVARDTLNNLVTQHGNEPPIPFNHMYFMSIEDFDLIMEALRANQHSLTKILEHAVKADMIPQTKKFTFGMHLYNLIPNLGAPNWLFNESKSITECCAKRFETKKPA